MTAHDLTLTGSKDPPCRNPKQTAENSSAVHEHLAAVDAEVRQCISALFDAQARQRIVLAHETGWITGDDAVGLLVTLDLIEVPHG